MKIKFLRLYDNAIVPDYATKGASGADLAIRLPGMGDTLSPGETKVFGTGICVEIPQGFEFQIRSRSGLSAKGVVVANSPGTIDSDYRGELQVILRNTGSQILTLHHGDRVAQVVLCPVMRIEWIPETELKTTLRAKNGLGSTGSK